MQTCPKVQVELTVQNGAKVAASYSSCCKANVPNFGLGPNRWRPGVASMHLAILRCKSRSRDAKVSTDCVSIHSRAASKPKSPVVLWDPARIDQASIRAGIPIRSYCPSRRLATA